MGSGASSGLSINAPVVVHGVTCLRITFFNFQMCNYTKYLYEWEEEYTLFCLKCKFIAIKLAIRTQIIKHIKKVKSMDFGQFIQLLVSAILGTASIYSMIQNAMLLAVLFMIVLYAVGIIFNHTSDKIHPKAAKYVLVEE
jgi:hypothetical protein